MTRHWRVISWAAVALVAFALATALASPTFTRSAYDPHSAAPEGSRAVAELLRSQGVSVERTTALERALSVGAGETLVVTNPALLPSRVVRDLQSSRADVVLLGPVRTPSGYDGVSAIAETDKRDRGPGCDLPAALRAGSARTGGVALAVAEGDATGCYLDDATGAPTLVQKAALDGSTSTVAGSAEFLMNEWVDDSGNAALALNLLGENQTLVWWIPAPVLTGQQSLTSLLPGGVWPVLGAVVAVVLLLALWQGRRLGPVVAEPLPVDVLASETTEGRARIYRRNKPRALAARHLRDLATSSISDRLGLPPGAGPPATVAAVASVTGRSADEVTRVLYGPPPERDDDLVALGRHLADLTEEVRRS
jgi:hypothetical protein